MSGKAKAPTEKELLEAEAADLSKRSRETEAALEAIRRSDGELTDAIADGAGEGKDTSALEAQLATIPHAIKAKEAALRGIAKRSAEVGARLSEINRAERLARLGERQQEIAAREATSDAEIAAALRGLGLVLGARGSLIAESEAVAIEMRSLGYNAGIVRPAAATIGEVVSQVQRERGRYHVTAEIVVPILT